MITSTWLNFVFNVCDVALLQGPQTSSIVNWSLGFHYELQKLQRKRPWPPQSGIANHLVLHLPCVSYPMRSGLVEKSNHSRPIYLRYYKWEYDVCWFEMILNYWIMVERYPNLKEEVGRSIPSYEISSLLDRKLAKLSTASCALALVCQPSVSKK